MINGSFVDTHCHIDMILEKQNLPSWDSLKATMEQVPEWALHVACHPQSFARAEELANANADIYLSFGVHPHDASSWNNEVHDQLAMHLKHPKCLAIGEMGLDYHYDYSPRDQQKQVFREQLQMATELGLPVVLHTREADQDTLEVMRETKDLRLHVHCYTGGLAFAKQLLQLPLEVRFGFTGIVTFKNAEEIREVVRWLPADRILLETDGPFLAPVPWRGKVAHPGMVLKIAEALAQVRDAPIAEFLAQCRENTRLHYDR